MATQTSKKPVQRSHFGGWEAATLGAIWLLGSVAMIVLATSHHAGDDISMENAIGYIVVGLVAVSILVLFRDLIEEWVRAKWIDGDG